MKTAKTATTKTAPAANVIGKAAKSAKPFPNMNTAKPEAKAKPEGKAVEAAASLGMIRGTDGALKFTNLWKPEAIALVANVERAASALKTAGEATMDALCDLFRMEVPKTLGYGSDAEFAIAMVRVVAPNDSAASTMNAWANAAAARYALAMAKIDHAPMGLDALRLVAQHGKADRTLMAHVGTSMLNEPGIRGSKGNIDARKARTWFEGEGKGASAIGEKTRAEKVKSIAAKAKRMGGGKEAGIDLLKEAMAYLAKAK